MPANMNALAYPLLYIYPGIPLHIPWHAPEYIPKDAPMLDTLGIPPSILQFNYHSGGLGRGRKGKEGVGKG